MLLRSVIASFFLLCNTSAFARYNNILDVDFMQSMTDGNPKAEKFLTSDPQYTHYLKVLQDNYEAKKPSNMRYSEIPLIPKVMHQVWVGGSDIPPLYQNYLDECKKLHPNWEFKIWGDKEVENLGLEYQDVYDKVRNYAGKSDILRYEILYRYGGIYRDMDVKCLAPIDDINHIYDFFVSIETQSDHPVLATGISGSSPKRKVFKDVLDQIRVDIDGQLKKWDFDSKHADPFAFGLDNLFHVFTHKFLQNINFNDKAITLPPSYLLPIFNIPSLTLVERNGLKYYLKSYFASLKPESLMWHNYEKADILPVNKVDEKYFSVYHNFNKVTNNLSADQLKIFNVFRDIYNQNASNKVNWNKHSKIPLEINFVVFNEDEAKILNAKLSEWIKLNRTFAIKVWDQTKILAEFPELNPLNRYSEDLRFLVALKIIERFGGHYADFKSTPHRPLFELGNKYNFYTGMMPVIDSKTKITLSRKLLGANIHHPILAKTLNQFNSAENITDIFVLETYKNIYLYGKNVVLPAPCLEPLADYDESDIDRIFRFIKKIPKPFSHITKYAIVE